MSHNMCVGAYACILVSHDVLMQSLAHSGRGSGGRTAARAIARARAAAQDAAREAISWQCHIHSPVRS